jgi:hypothetical protein
MSAGQSAADGAADTTVTMAPAAAAAANDSDADADLEILDAGCDVEVL